MMRWLLLLAVSSVWAAPPVDLAGDEANGKGPSRRRALTPDDLVYTENVKSDETQLAREAGKIVFQVTGRSLPNRRGRPLHVFHPEDLVKIIGPSKDGHWSAVETVHAVKGGVKVKAWIPKNAVKPPEPKAPEEKEEKKDEGAASSAETNPAGNAESPQQNVPNF